MDEPRLTIALTVDADYISDAVRRGDPPVKLSHGEFGARVGMPRLLDLFERHAIPSTVFIPGHSIETWPDLARRTVEAGHELAVHGWFHEDFSTLSAKDARDVLERSKDAIAALTGAPPVGHRAPYWALAEETLGIVEDAGFAYDSSLMADDYFLYRVRRDDRHSTTDGTRWGREGGLVEVPVYWALDDWPQFEPGDDGRPGLSAPSKVQELWMGEVRYAHEHAPGGLVTVTVHPECIGRGHRMAMLEEFVIEASSLDGVVFERLDRFVEGWVGSGGQAQPRVPGETGS